MAEGGNDLCNDVQGGSGGDGRGGEGRSLPFVGMPLTRGPRVAGVGAQRQRGRGDEGQCGRGGWADGTRETKYGRR